MLAVPASAVSACLLMPLFSARRRSLSEQSKYLLTLFSRRCQAHGTRFRLCIVLGLVLHLARTFSQQNRRRRAEGRPDARDASAALFPRAGQPATNRHGACTFATGKAFPLGATLSRAF